MVEPGRFYRQEIPEVFKSLNLKKDSAKIEVFALPDFIPLNILKFVYNTQETKELIELSLYDSQTNKGIVDSPLLATSEFHEKYISENLNPHNMIDILKHYIFLTEAKSHYTQARVSLQKMLAVPEKNLGRVISATFNSDELSDIEKEMIKSFDTWGYKLDLNEKEINEWILHLRYDKLAKKTYSDIHLKLNAELRVPRLKLGWTSNHRDADKIPETDKKTLYQIKEYLEERKLYADASDISNIIGDTNSDLDNKIKFYETFNKHFRKDYAANVLFNIIIQAKYAGKDELCSSWIDFYAKNQSSMEGVFRSSQDEADWIIGIAKSYDHEFGQWETKKIKTEPLIQKAIFNVRHYPFDEDKKVALSREIMEKCGFDKDKYTQQIRYRFQNIQACGDWMQKDLKELTAFLARTGVELTPSLELK